MTKKKLMSQFVDSSEDWENGDLGQSPEHAVLAPSQLATEIDDALGMQMISIRLNKDLIESLKLLGIKHELGYQTLIREVLNRFVDGEYKMIAQDALEKQKNQKIRAENKKLAKAA
ncbi:hypothetical protein [Polynucleobacter antarcticus]|uniref:Uncharacterized protein n=1 Tax=Polynucleobacter antarcticus TaxID=1743162 RepID=A0A6M9Q2W3_9BURK|nr:hypothetical protein [Polynucleobacter antarcticus]QKM62693.1 hypothetical protein DCO16_06265 [Polynucleobacter antarcticus]